MVGEPIDQRGGAGGVGKHRVPGRERQIGGEDHRPLLVAAGDDLEEQVGDSRLADLLFEVVTRRYNERSTLITTNKTFAEWQDVFPNAACVVTLVDRLVHKAEILTIEGNSYRLKEAQERAALKAKNRKSRPPRLPK